MSAESRELSSVSVEAFLGKPQAVTIVVREGMSCPASGTPEDVRCCGAREQPVPAARIPPPAARIKVNASAVARVMA